MLLKRENASPILVGIAFLGARHLCVPAVSAALVLAACAFLQSPLVLAACAPLQSPLVLAACAPLQSPVVLAACAPLQSPLVIAASAYCSLRWC